MDRSWSIALVVGLIANIALFVEIFNLKMKTLPTFPYIMSYGMIAVGFYFVGFVLPDLLAKSIKQSHTIWLIFGFLFVALVGLLMVFQGGVIDAIWNYAIIYLIVAVEIGTVAHLFGHFLKKDNVDIFSF